MVDSDNGHQQPPRPSDVIVDASMPAMIRASGHMWGPDGNEADTLAVIPDSSYAGIYQVTSTTAAPTAPTTRHHGSVPNVGLMAQKAEEYGSHDKTFEMPAAGTVRVVDGAATRCSSTPSSAGDIWRMCQTKDCPIRDWVQAGRIARPRDRAPAVFWLDETRAHDAKLIAKVQSTSRTRHRRPPDRDHGPDDATRFSLERIREGEDTISVTGNVLRDYLTDLFPILEVGTSAKMLSIVPLIERRRPVRDRRRRLAPKHVQQFDEGKPPSLGQPGRIPRPGRELRASGRDDRQRPGADPRRHAGPGDRHVPQREQVASRRGGEIDNRGSHFYLALYWAEELAAQGDDAELSASFMKLADTLRANELAITEELLSVQGHEVDVGGYYQPDPEKAAAAMRPSKTFNENLALLKQLGR